MIEENNIREAGSKNEVFAAYHELLRKLKETQKTVTVQEEKIIEEKQQIIEEKQEIVEVAIEEAITSDLPQHLSNLKASMNQMLDDIEPKLLAEQKKFATLQQAIEIQTHELQEHYEIKKVADTLHVLLSTHKEKVAALDQEIMQRKRHWKKEQEEYESAYQNQQAQAKSDQKREEEEYLYKRDQTRQKEQDQYEATKRNMEHELTVKRLQVEEEFRIREAQIAVREHEFNAMKDRMAKLPEELQRVISETEKNVGDKLQIKYEYEMKLMEKDFENERKAHKQTVAAYAAEVEHLKSINYSFNTTSFTPQNSPDKLY